MASTITTRNDYIKLQLKAYFTSPVQISDYNAKAARYLTDKSVSLRALRERQQYALKVVSDIAGCPPTGRFEGKRLSVFQFKLMVDVVKALADAGCLDTTVLSAEERLSYFMWLVPPKDAIYCAIQADKRFPGITANVEFSTQTLRRAFSAAADIDDLRKIYRGAFEMGLFPQEPVRCAIAEILSVGVETDAKDAEFAAEIGLNASDFEDDTHPVACYLARHLPSSPSS